VDFEDMSKEELIAMLKELKKQRAFSYEDQMKLAILDESPFTIWASDRDCKITLWEGQCEALYGYSRDFAIGKDYIPLFVAPDEQPAARRDQISIIDDAAVFHNIANDIAKNGNTLQLITNCFRIKDPRTGHYWNAEMGLIIDYLEQEKERLELIVTESRKVKSYVNLFIENTYQRKEQFLARKKAIREAISESQRKAAAVKRITSFREKTAPINRKLDELQQRLWLLIEDYYQKIQACVEADSCEAIRLEFNETYDEMLFAFEDIVLDFEEINSEFNWDNTVMQLRDDLLKDISLRNFRLGSLVFDLLNKANEEINDYRKIGDVRPDSSRMTTLIKRRDNIQSLKDAIDRVADNFIERITQANGNEQLTTLRTEMGAEYARIETKLSGAKTEMEAIA
jgi:PAS domain S-box-containing protein